MLQKLHDINKIILIQCIVWLVVVIYIGVRLNTRFNCFELFMLKNN